MSKRIYVGGRIESAEQGGVVTGANAILDDTKGKKQNVINSETDTELERLDGAKQDVLTFDNAPTEGSNNPVKSGGVYAADAALQQAIEAILQLIPSAATALNQLADKAFVNSTVATNTATFRGTYNVVTDLSLHYNSTHQEIATALLSVVQTADNNDYCFVQIPVSDSSGDIRVTERYKFNGTAWSYEYDLNNSGFTADQWAAINSTITLALVQKLGALPTAAELAQQLALKQNTLTFDSAPVADSSNPVTSGGLYNVIAAINATIPSGASVDNKLVAESRLTQYVAAIVNALDATFNVTSTDGHVNVRLTQVNGVITSVEVITNDIASASALNTLAGRVTTNEGDISAEVTRATQAEADLRALYNALQQSAPEVIEPTDTWPVASPSATVIYRVIDRVNTPPQYYSDYMFSANDLTTPVLMATYDNAIDPRPKKGSQNLVTSCGVFDNMGALDVSELNATENPHTLATYADLSAALAAIPSDYQKGGMSIKFVQSSDNKYVQYRLMKNTWSTTKADWQGVDDEPTAGSDNLVKSGGVLEQTTSLTEVIRKSVTTIAEGLVQVYFRGIFQAGTYCIKCSGITAAKYVSLYNGSTLIKEDVVVMTENDKCYYFDAPAAFDRVLIFSFNAENINVQFYKTSLLSKEEKIKDNVIVSAKDILWSYGNVTESGEVVTTYDNVVSELLTIPDGASLLWLGDLLENYTCRMFFYDNSQNLLNYLDVEGTQVILPNTAKYYRALIYDQPFIGDIIASSLFFCFETTGVLIEQVEKISTDLYGRQIDTSELTLKQGNIADGHPEPSNNVITDGFMKIPTSKKIKCYLDDWNVAVFGYTGQDYDTYTSLWMITAHTEKEIIFTTENYFILVFWKNGVLPSIQDIQNDGFYMVYQNSIDSKLVTDSFLEARKDIVNERIIIKPSLFLNREKGNILWNGAKRLARNPLNMVDTPDPTIVKIGEYYYMACTWFPVRIFRSADGVNWEFYRNVFTGTNNDPFNTGATDPFDMGSTDLNYWAPSIFTHNNKVYIYVYTIDNNDYTIAATQLFVADNIESAFSWVGTVNEDGVSNAEFRDTQYFKDSNGDIYISSGDGSSSFIRIAKMSSDLITVDGHSWRIYDVVHEGTLLFKHNGWYYLFFSGGNTSLTTYNVHCFRSQDITAEHWENCGLLLEQSDSSNPLNSTGHVGEVIEDNDGNLFMYMHCHCYGLTLNDQQGYGKRYLYAQRLVFDNNDMPHFVDKDGNVTTLPQWLLECPNV